MSHNLRLAIGQIDPIVGDFAGNSKKIIEYSKEAENKNADLVIFPELAICGYPPEDLALKKGFVNECERHADQVATQIGKIVSIFGSLEADKDVLGPTSESSYEHFAYNSALICANGSKLASYHKKYLPNYAVFDEVRTFVPSKSPVQIYLIAGIKIGILICEDLWKGDDLIRQYSDLGAGLFIVLNASPFYSNRLSERIEELSKKTPLLPKRVVYVNMVGGQDELIFDGGSFVFDPKEGIIFKMHQFVEELGVFDLEIDNEEEKGFKSKPIAVTLRSKPQSVSLLPSYARDLGEIEELYNALIVGARDYVIKNEFNGAIVGLSGGIDSSLVATLAVDALGEELVTGVSMPSKYTSNSSKDDAALLARNLGIEYIEIPIHKLHSAFSKIITGAKIDVTGLPDENIQSRIRGVILMALSNATGKIVLTTSNKSELAVGYSTLYGDTAGGFALLKDIYKSQVYELSKYRNKLSAVIPESVLEKAPSAELRENQKDSDSLPPYELLDAVLQMYVEQNLTKSEIIELNNLDSEIVQKIVDLVDRAEYKRRQSPVGARVSKRSFGKDRRIPITNRFK